MFGSLTAEEALALRERLQSAHSKLARVTITLGDVCLHTLGTGNESESTVWAVRERFDAPLWETAELVDELAIP